METGTATEQMLIGGNIINHNIIGEVHLGQIVHMLGPNSKEIGPIALELL